MPDEIGKEVTRAYTLQGDNSLSGGATDKADYAPDVVVKKETAQEAQGAADAGDKPAAEANASAPENLKVVVSIKGGRATIGVQRPSSDPHVESFDDMDLSGLAQEVPAVTERARAKWQETPKHPAYARPAPPPRRRNRRQQGAAQDATNRAEADQAQQQTLKLF